MNSWRVIVGDALERLRELEDGSVQTCVTSPPYFGLRDYGTGAWEGGDDGCDHLGEPFRTKAKLNENWGAGFSDVKNTEDREPMGQTCSKCDAARVDSQVGLEATPDEYVARLVEVFREVRRVLRDDGTLWLNLGDSYNSSPPGNKNPMSKSGLNGAQTSEKYRARLEDTQQRQQEGRSLVEGCKPKDLLGIPWMVAFALRADGWYLRSDIVWAKPNPMPESVTDRPTKSHEYVFLLSKSPRYFYDADAIREDATEVGIAREGRARDTPAHSPPGTQPNRRSTSNGDADWLPPGRNKRSVWTVATQPYAEAHFATFPPKLIEPCVKAGSAEDACGVCGAPWVRVVERTAIRDLWDGGPREGGKLAGRQEQGLTSKRTGLSASNSHNDATPQSPEVRTVGFELSCDHQETWCPSCSVVLGTDGGFKSDTSGRTAADVPAVRGDVPEPERQVAMVQQGVQGTLGGEEPSNDDGSHDLIQGLCPSPQTGASASAEGRLRDGTPAGDGAGTRAAAHGGGGGASHQRREGGQSHGEPGSDARERTQSQTETTEARSNDSVPALSGDDLRHGACPRCGGPLECRPSRSGSSVILDCFSGAGTTGLVATRLGRSYIGIELNESYAEMSRERIRDDAPLMNYILEQEEVSPHA